MIYTRIRYIGGKNQIFLERKHKKRTVNERRISKECREISCWKTSFVKSSIVFKKQNKTPKNPKQTTHPLIFYSSFLKFSEAFTGTIKQVAVHLALQQPEIDSSLYILGGAADVVVAPLLLPTRTENPQSRTRARWDRFGCWETQSHLFVASPNQVFL